MCHGQHIELFSVKGDGYQIYLDLGIYILYIVPTMFGIPCLFLDTHGSPP